MSALRVGIVGGRRVRQGLGPFVARDFERAGATVRAVLGTSQTTADAAAEQIRETCGATPTAFADADSFYGSELDVVCVLSPAGTHVAHVERALEARGHVFCEKPFAWDPEERWAERARELEDAFDAAGLVLRTNTQWPFTLPAFEALTGVTTNGAGTLAMGMAPASTGKQMLGDALPHPLSVAQALHPGLERAVDVSFDAPSDRSLTVRARLVGDGGSLDVEVELRGDALEVPREAWLAIDGRRADRCVREGDYALFLREGARVVDLPDPLSGCVESFVRAAEGTATGDSPAIGSISRRAAMLEDIVRAYDLRPE